MPHSFPTRGRASALLIALLPCQLATADRQWQAGVTSIYQSTDARHTEPLVSSSADLTFTLTRPAGTWFVYFEASNQPTADAVAARYPSANADAGSVVDGIDGGAQISELHYTVSLTADRQLQLGLMDVSVWLDTSAITNDETRHFINSSLVNNPTIEFPDYTLGAAFRHPGTGALPGLNLVVSRSAGLADFSIRDYGKLLDSSADQSGIFVAAQAHWATGRSTYGVGLWHNGADHPVAGRPATERPSYGGYATWSWSAGPHTVDARVGAADDHTSAAARFAALAYVRDAGHGEFGVGLAHTWLSSAFRTTGLDDHLDAELFYRVALGDGALALTPSIQFVRNPDFDASGVASDARATIVGLRFQWRTP